MNANPVVKKIMQMCILQTVDVAADTRDCCLYTQTQSPHSLLLEVEVDHTLWALMNVSSIS